MRSRSKIIIALFSAFLFLHGESFAYSRGPEVWVTPFFARIFQRPKPYIGFGLSFYELNYRRPEKQSDDFIHNMRSLQNMTFFGGLRINGFISVEFGMNTIDMLVKEDIMYSPKAIGSKFNAQMFYLKTMFYPFAINIDMVSIEPFLSTGIGLMAGRSGYFATSGHYIKYNFPLKPVLTYGGGVEVSFIKFISFRAGIDFIMPIGSPFPHPASRDIMLVYNLGIAIYPF